MLFIPPDFWVDAVSSSESLDTSDTFPNMPMRCSNQNVLTAPRKEKKAGWLGMVWNQDIWFQCSNMSICILLLQWANSSFAPSTTKMSSHWNVIGSRHDIAKHITWLVGKQQSFTHFNRCVQKYHLIVFGLTRRAI
jgi:hypothetical protein